MTTPTIRPGTAEDVPTVLALLDRATEWLVARGRTNQWGTEPHSTNARRIDQVGGFAADGGLWIAERDGVPVGAMALGAALPYVPAATEPELYLRLLVTERSLTGSGIGTALLEHARALGREQGVGLLRGDCFGGGDEALVRYYEREGFTRGEPFSVPLGDASWPGRIIHQRL